jgi:splicing factor 3A subunit 1
MRAEVAEALLFASRPPILQDTVGHLKSRLEGVTGLAVNKQKLHRDGVGFLRDELSLAHYNISPDVVLVLGTKTRGGKK